VYATVPEAQVIGAGLAIVTVGRFVTLRRDALPIEAYLSYSEGSRGARLTPVESKAERDGSPGESREISHEDVTAFQFRTATRGFASCGQHFRVDEEQDAGLHAVPWKLGIDPNTQRHTTREDSNEAEQ
jgi:hypothetical protein